MPIPDSLKKELLTVPNLLTLLRIFCVPIVVFLMIKNTPAFDITAAIVFGLASMTDLIDGWIARRWNQVSKMGILIDPLADKLLIISVLIILVHQNKIDTVIPVILIWREFGILTLRSVASSHGIMISASYFGKNKTLLQIIGIICIIVGRGNEFLGVNWFAIGYLNILVSLFVSVLSGYQYLREYIKSVYKV